jgi:hypothetical protein
MFSYNDFKSTVRQMGVSRQNRFSVMIAPPAALESTNLQSVILFCKGVSVPGVNIVTAPVRTTGETIEAGYDRTFGAASMNFYVDTDLKVRYFFDEWMNLIQNSDTRIFNYPNDYKARTIEISVLRLDNNISYMITLYEAFPKSIDPINLSSDENGVMTLGVSFDFKYYKTELITQSKIRESQNQQLIGASSQGFTYAPDIGYDFP